MAADDHRPSDLYERDFYLWTQAQAEALRAEGGRQTAGSNVIDWEHVAEEIEDMGGRDVRECYSRVRTILEHLYKLAWSQQTAPIAGWRTTIHTQRSDLRYVLTASIRPKVEQELESLHRDAALAAADGFDAAEPSVARDETLRWRLDQILGERDDPIA